MRELVVAVDVGTGSARAGVFDAVGALLGRGEHSIAMNRPRPGFAEQDSEDIWRAVSAAVRGAMEQAGAPPESVAGISFDATCSLVMRDREGAPLSVSEGGESRWDTVVWLDHRAIAEAEECTATGHEVLDYLGGVMSPEMQSPKMMWLKRRFPDRWARAGRLFDLTDFLTWRASGANDRSQCTLTCKWTYLAHEDAPWRADFLEAVGLSDMRERGGLPERASPVGADLGPLTPDAAADLGLTEGCRVGVGLIDAHAGALGALGGRVAAAGADRRMALIAGTSSCLMALSPDPRPTPGFWGPYLGAVTPELWLNEGGQSATGALLDHVIRLTGGTPDGETHRKIIARIGELRAEEGEGFAERLHVLPDFHGNRSPLAEPRALGVISGLRLDSGFDALCRLYYRTAVGLALGVRHILDALNGRGYDIDTLHIAGGQTRNPLMMTLYADATGCRVVEPENADAVLLGTAMVAATAAGLHPGPSAAAQAMGREGRARSPDPAEAEGFARDYRVFLAMHEQRRALDEIR